MKLFGNKKYLILIILSFIFYFNKTFAIQNNIILKINNIIITSIDVENEINYLKTLNEKFLNLDDRTIYNVAKNSLIRETIKKNEIYKYVNEIKLDENYLEDLIRKKYLAIGFNSKEEFLFFIQENNLKIETIKNKFATEAIWNQLIFSKYSDKVKVDENQLRKKISEIQNNKINIYFLSEILFEIPNEENYEKKFIEIEDKIKEIGFENAASIYSISDSSKLGGKIGWVEETYLSSELKKKLRNTAIGEITKPTSTPGGFLILKINEIKKKEIKYDLEKEVKKMINIEKNKQFNQFSNIYFNKIKMDTVINEL